MRDVILRKWLFGAGTTVLILWFIASFWHSRFTWGFDYLQYYPIWLRVVWLLAGIVLLIIAGVYHNKMCSLLSTPKIWLPLIIVLFFSGLCFSLLRARVPLLGDGYLRLLDLQIGNIVSVTAPVTTLLIHGLYRLFRLLTTDVHSAYLAYGLMSILAGLGTVTVYYFVARSWFPRMWPFVILLFITLGFNQIFFGYIETYALFGMVAACYLWSGICSFEQRKAPLVASVLCALCISVHSAGLFLIPSLLFLWFRCVLQRTCRMSSMITSVVLFLVVPLCAVALTRIVAGERLFTYALTKAPISPFLSFSQEQYGYTVFSRAHLLDIVNQLLLIIPALLFLVLHLFGSAKQITLERPGVFLLIAAVGALCFVLLIDPKLGMRRDWDLFAWTALPVAFSVLFLAKSRKEHTVLAVTAVLSLWLFWPWIGINGSEARSLARYKTVLINEDRAVAYGYRNLALYYDERGNHDMKMRAYEQATRSEPENAQAAHAYAKVLVQEDKPDSAVQYFRKAAALDSLNARYWDDLGRILIPLARYDEAVASLNRAAVLNKGNPVTLANLGSAYLNLGQWAKADSVFALAHQRGMDDAWFYLSWGKAQVQNGMYEKALRTLNTALRKGAPRERVMPLYNEAEAAQ